MLLFPIQLSCFLVLLTVSVSLALPQERIVGGTDAALGLLWFWGWFVNFPSWTLFQMSIFCFRKFLFNMPLHVITSYIYKGQWSHLLLWQVSFHSWSPLYTSHYLVLAIISVEGPSTMRWFKGHDSTRREHDQTHNMIWPAYCPSFHRTVMTVAQC